VREKRLTTPKGYRAQPANRGDSRAKASDVATTSRRAPRPRVEEGHELQSAAPGERVEDRDLTEDVPPSIIFTPIKETRAGSGRRDR
jgi:hypothetical protein